jgi:uncharacterized protein YcbK (DUF882 family)
MDWSLYPNFTEAEMRCKHTGKCEMRPVFMQRLQHLRSVYGAPMTVTSGYRDRTHPEEAKKAQPGAHTTGRAVDIAVRGADAVKLLRLALEFGFTGIGIQQKGEGRFIHLDDISDGSLPRPGLWSY